MNPEEFDNRLRNSFQDEYLPPRQNLWVNISEKLDQKAAKPNWRWLTPVLVAVTVCIIWLGLVLTGVEKDKVAEDVLKENQGPLASTPSIGSTVESGIPEKIPAGSGKKQDVHPGAGHKQPAGIVRDNIPQPPLPDRNALSKAAARHKDASLDDYFNSNPQIENIVKNPETRSNEGGISGEEIISYLRCASIKRFQYSIELENQYLIAFNQDKGNTGKNTPFRKNPSITDMGSRHWLNFGLGPQLAFNNLVINNDSQAYIHKYLWDNKKMITHNGTGFNAFATYSYKFGKKNRFSFETGLTYSLRTEDIKFNESTYDIATRDNNNKISNYIGLKVWIAIPKNPGPGFDTTFYDAIQNFSMAVNNKYHIFTVPLRFNSEHKISENTFFTVGLGAGISMISANKSVHYNLVREKESKSTNERYFSGSLNSQLAVYTNFNDLGLLGIYTGFQTYLKPWTVSNNQYSIRMSDLQLGITFRKPL